MTVEATYTWELDTGRDDQFATDISNYVVETEIEWGADKPFMHMARLATMKLTVTNEGQKFSPAHGNALSGLNVGCPGRWKMSYGGTDQYHYTGWLTDLSPDPYAKGSRRATLEFEGLLRRYKETDARIALQTSIHVDEAMIKLIEAAEVLPPGFIGWVLGHPFYSRLGESTILSSSDDYTDIDDGDDRSLWLTNFGDQLKDNLLDTLKELAETDRGLFWVDGAGIASYLPRTAIVSKWQDAVDLTLTLTQMTPPPIYAWVPFKANRVTAQISPRDIGTSQITVGALDRDVKIGRGETVTVTIPFQNADGDPMGAYEVQDVTATTDYQAYARIFYLYNRTINITSYCSAITTVFGDRVEVDFTLDSNAPGEGWDLTVEDIQVRGKPIYLYDKETIVYQDDDDVEDNNVFPADFSLKLMHDAEFAAGWARDVVLARKDDQGYFQEVTISANKNATTMAAVRDINAGKVWSISDTDQTGESAKKYMVIGGKETLIGKNHLLTAYLQPLPPQGFILGDATYGVLGSTTTLALTHKE